MKAFFYYLIHFYFFYLPAVCLPARAYTYIHCSPSHKQYTCNTHKHSENQSLSVARLTEPGSQQHPNCRRRAQGRAKAGTGLPRPRDWLFSRSNPSVKQSIFRAVLLCISCQQLRASTVFRRCWDVLTILPCLKLLTLCSTATVTATE